MQGHEVQCIVQAAFCGRPNLKQVSYPVLYAGGGAAAAAAAGGASAAAAAAGAAPLLPYNLPLQGFSS